MVHLDLPGSNRPGLQWRKSLNTFTCTHTSTICGPKRMTSRWLDGAYVMYQACGIAYIELPFPADRDFLFLMAGLTDREINLPMNWARVKLMQLRSAQLSAVYKWASL